MDRYVLGGALLLGAAFGLSAFSGSRVIAYLAGAVGLVFLHERLRREFSPAAATLTSLLLFAGTSLFWSMTRAAAPVDALVFALAAGGLLAASRLKSPAPRLAMWAAVSVILVANVVAFGVPEFSGASARAVDQLFSSTGGFLSLSPIAYVGLIGTVAYVLRDRVAGGASLLTLALCVIAAAIVPRANANPFDNGLTPALTLLVSGVAFAIDFARSRPLVAAIPLVAGAALWNYGLMVQYTAGALPKDEPVSFAAMVRQQADVLTRPPYVHPLAFPANLFFAWREGVPIDRYEVLSQVPRGTSWDVIMDRSVDAFLLDGWGGAGTTPFGPVRWTAGRRATITFPLSPTTSATIIQLVASARVEEPAVNAELGLEVNGSEIGRFIATQTPEETTLTVPAASVGRVLRAGYNRLSIVFYGVHRANSEDQRALGPLAARSGEIPFPVAIHRVRITSQ